MNEAVEKFENSGSVFKPETIMKNAERFARSRFKNEIDGYITKKIQEFYGEDEST